MTAVLDHLILAHTNMGTESDRRRLLIKLDASGGPDSCWPFGGARKPGGYGNFWLSGRHVGAHVAAYLLFVGAIPDGTEVDHRCHDPRSCAGGSGCAHRSCCNPDHLKAVTHRENDLRGAGVSAINVLKTHCVSGHPFDLENTYRAPGSPHERHCRTCMANRRGQPARPERV